MERKIIENLIEWKNSPSRKPLILQGARQTGKTYSVTEFGTKYYSDVVYCNFERDPDLSSIFSNLAPSHILPRLSAIKQKKVFPRETLVIFDEVQACPEALTSLKYFCEETPDIHIIALGSLLGVAVNRNQYSFPVGKVEIIDMHPLDFEEFLTAREENFLLEQIKECYAENKPLEEALHKKALEAYREYLFVGGMPAAVSNFVQNHNSLQTDIIKNDILAAYQNDMSKYNKQSEIAKTRLVYASIGKQLAKENKKFQISKVASGARFRDYRGCIEWLLDAGIVQACYCLNYPELPLKGNYNADKFKLYYADSGLLIATLDAEAQKEFRAYRNIGVYKGALYENIIAEALVKSDLPLYYYKKDDSTLEEDFFARSANDLVPIEVKSTNNASKSLRTLIRSQSYPEIHYGIKLIEGNLGYAKQIYSFPHFCAFLLNHFLQNHNQKAAGSDPSDRSGIHLQLSEER